MKHIPIGTVVCVEAPGSRVSNGESRTIPAIVTGQWPDGSLEVYGFHFEGMPILLRQVPLANVRMVGQTEPIEMVAPARSFTIA